MASSRAKPTRIFSTLIDLDLSTRLIIHLIIPLPTVEIAILLFEA